MIVFGYFRNNTTETLAETSEGEVGSLLTLVDIYRKPSLVQRHDVTTRAIAMTFKQISYLFVVSLRRIFRYRIMQIYFFITQERNKLLHFESSVPLSFRLQGFEGFKTCLKEYGRARQREE